MKYLTIQGQRALLEELAYLTKTKRVEIAEQLKFASSFGDLRENSEYDAVCEEFQIIENRIYEIECYLKDSVIYQKKNDGTVEIGSTVTLEIYNEIETYIIVGIGESDIKNNKISYESPLALVLLGKSINQIVLVESNIGNYSVKIIDIN